MTDNLIWTMNWLVVVQACFVSASVVGVLTDGLASLTRLGISVTSFLIIVVPLALTRFTKHKGYVTHFSLVWLVYYSIVNNALMWYVLSEKGQQLGREQFGDEHEAKLNILLSTMKPNLPYIYGISITLLNTDFISVIPKTLTLIAASSF